MQKNVLKKLFICHKRDLFLGAGLLLAASCLFLVLRIFQTDSGSFITVKSNGKIIATYSLDQDLTTEIKFLDNSNTLVIKDGQATVTDSTCKDHICEDMGPISKKGEMIICLPNELFISVVSGKEADVDAVVQ